MSTITTQQTSSIPVPLPPNPELHNGDRLTREEFHRRYVAMPRIHKAELIEGVVYMPSPVRQVQHGKPHVHVSAWIGAYSAQTPGVDPGDNSSLILDFKNEPQPDSLLMIVPECGGQARLIDGYIVGAPDWIGEIAASTASNDLHDKLTAYRRNGVKEYFVWRVEDRAIDWFVQRGDRFEPLTPSSEGVFKSAAFPGLWLDSEALLAGNLSRVLEVVQQGLRTPEHAAFVEELAQKRGRA